MFSIMLFINIVHIIHKKFNIININIAFLVVALFSIIMYEALVINVGGSSLNYIEFELIFNLPIVIYLSYKVLRKKNGMKATPNNRGKRL